MGCLECFDCIVKFTLVRFNVIFAITGLVLISLGSYVEIEAKKYLDFLGDVYDNTPAFIIILGVLIFVMSFLGCCGACKDQPCIMYTYAAILAIIIIAEIGAGIASYVLKGAIKDVVEGNMEEGMDSYNTEGHEDMTRTWDRMQEDVKCCGVKGYKDWINSTYGAYPDSCCVGGLVKGCGESKEKYTKGCLEALENQFMSSLSMIGNVAIGIPLVQGVGIFLACCIGNKIRN